MSEQPRFRRIVCIDRVGLTEAGFRELEGLSQEPLVRHADSPTSSVEIVRRIRGADCVLVSWDTHIRGDVLRLCPELVYIGMCCSLYDERSANVDIAAARKMGMMVRGIRDYGDVGLVEFILSELIYLFKGLGTRQWGPEPEELAGKKLAIIGFGRAGQLLARMAALFGMDVSYYSRTRKPSCETDSLQYMDLDSLLPWADVISVHVPRNTQVLASRHFSLIRSGAVLVNTSLGRRTTSRHFERGSLAARTTSFLMAMASEA